MSVYCQCRVQSSTIQHHYVSVLSMQGAKQYNSTSLCQCIVNAGCKVVQFNITMSVYCQCRVQSSTIQHHYVSELSMQGAKQYNSTSLCQCIVNAGCKVVQFNITMSVYCQCRVQSSTIQHHYVSELSMQGAKQYNSTSLCQCIVNAGCKVSIQHHYVSVLSMQDAKQYNSTSLCQCIVNAGCKVVQFNITMSVYCQCRVQSSTIQHHYVSVLSMQGAKQYNSTSLCQCIVNAGCKVVQFNITMSVYCQCRVQSSTIQHHYVSVLSMQGAKQYNSTSLCRCIVNAGCKVVQFNITMSVYCQCRVQSSTIQHHYVSVLSMQGAKQYNSTSLCQCIVNAGCKVVQFNITMSVYCQCRVQSSTIQHHYVSVLSMQGAKQYNSTSLCQCIVNAGCKVVQFNITMSVNCQCRVQSSTIQHHYVSVLSMQGAKQYNSTSLCQCIVNAGCKVVQFNITMSVYCQCRVQSSTIQHHYVSVLSMQGAKQYNSTSLCQCIVNAGCKVVQFNITMSVYCQCQGAKQYNSTSLCQCIVNAGCKVVQFNITMSVYCQCRVQSSTIQHHYVSVLSMQGAKQYNSTSLCQ